MSAINNRLMEIIAANKNMVKMFDFSSDTIKTIILKNGWNMQQAIQMQSELNLATDNSVSFDIETIRFTIDFSCKFPKYRALPYGANYPFYGEYVYGDTWAISPNDNTNQIEVYLVTGESRVLVATETLMMLVNGDYKRYQISDIFSDFFPQTYECGCCY